jgi:ABC-type multidrug transport system ATPase subunit/uncharacterized tellurite resistance protein B-like protein
MPGNLSDVLDAARPHLAGESSRETAAAVLTAFALMALGDEVTTVTERRALSAVLARDWGIELDLPAVDRLLEAVAGVPRHLLLRELDARLSGWPAEQARRLMAGLTEVVGADGHVAWGEQVLLQRYATALGLEQPATRPSPRRGPSVLSTVTVGDGESVHVGRSLSAEICLLRAPIAARQVRLTERGGRIAFQNLGETIAVAWRGEPAAEGTLAPGGELSVGRYRIRWEAERRELAVIHPGFSTVLRAQDLATVVRREGHDRTLLDGVSFRARAGQMVAIIGPSGSGKSTLLHLLRGELPASRGRVTLDGLSVAPGAAVTIRRISFVPQEELLLAALTVEESISFTARLKGLHAGAAGGGAGGLVDEMLERVGLSAHEVRRTPIGDTVKRGISGGQRRRVSVAQELVGDDTDVLLLDEPTSGLDPLSEAGVLALMRDLADGGKIVISSTHAVELENLRVFDSVLCLNAAGRPAYFGPPAALAEKFGARSIVEIFEQLEARADAPAASPAAHLSTTLSLTGTLSGGLALAFEGPSSGRRASPALGFLAQVAILLRREATVRARDVVSLGLAVALPVAVALLCSLVYFRGCVHPILMFVLCLAGLWAGVSFTVRDITSQFALLRHESRTRAAVGAAYTAKAIIAAAASALQALLLTASIFSLFGGRRAGAYVDWPGMLELVSLSSPLMIFSVLWASHLLGNAIGALLSATFRTAESAIFMIPFVLLPMVALSGALVPPSELPASLRSAINVNPLYHAYVGMLGSSASVCQIDPVDLEDPARMDRSAACKLRERIKLPPEGVTHLAPFTQSEGSCLHNTFLRANEFGRMAGLPRAPLAGGVLEQLSPSLVGRSLGVLLGITALLHLCAVRVCARRVRTL